MKEYQTDELSLVQIIQNQTLDEPMAPLVKRLAALELIQDPSTSIKSILDTLTYLKEWEALKQWMYIHYQASFDNGKLTFESLDYLGRERAILSSALEQNFGLC